MADSLPPNPNPTSPPPPNPTADLPTTAPSQSFCPPSMPIPSPFLRRPPIRATTEFDSESNLFLHKLSCKLADGLAKLKLSCQSDRKGQLGLPQIGFITKHFKVFYDVESRNALLNGSVDVGRFVQLRATHDVKCGEIGIPDFVHIGSSRDSLSFSCTYKSNHSILACLNLANLFSFKYHFFKEKAGEVAMITNLGDPLYKFELSSLVPSIGLPRATVKFPLGEISLEESVINEETEEKKILSLSGIVRSNILDGVGTAIFTNNDLNLRYCYKDKEMTFIPSISMPTNALSFAFKRHFSPSDKLSYMYHFESNDWNAVYKHKIDKHLKFKAGYDSSTEGGLRWASIWVGDEEGGAKGSPMKMKLKFMLQVPQDVNQSVFLFHVKKRWDF